MTWKVHQEGPILDGNRVVGSMIEKTRGGIGLTKPEEKIWRVEILWMTGDIVYDTAVYAAALAFILGVARAFDGLKKTPGAGLCDRATRRKLNRKRKKQKPRRGNLSRLFSSRSANPPKGNP